MPPLPKKKTSLARKRGRRAHITASVPALMVCPQCRSPKIQHQACHVCGTYKGRQVLNVHREPRTPTT
ncbi:MAG: 50S ribosomal protein L32 [Dehalococcoidia bacterium]